MADERFLKEAEKMVLGEFAYVLNALHILVDVPLSAFV